MKIINLGSSTFRMKCQAALEALFCIRPIPTGLKHLAQGCEKRATLGENVEKRQTLKGLNRFHKCLVNPFRVFKINNATQGSPSRVGTTVGLIDSIPLGLKRHGFQRMKEHAKSIQLKTSGNLDLRCFAMLLTLTGYCAVAEPDLSHTVPFELGKSQFEPGDNITIEQVHGTSDTIKVGETYSVDGTYTLSSKDQALLGLFVTTSGPSAPTPIDPKQVLRIKKGAGSFHLVETMSVDGSFHVSFYEGNSFGGVYFGQGHGVQRQRLKEASSPNEILYAYLGDPVPTPANLDYRYTKEGLTNALKLAAANAGITLKKIAVDDAEFPFLVGVVCQGNDYIKLKAALGKMDGYEYNGSVGNDRNSDGSDTCNAFCIVPYKACPISSWRQIERRRMLRYQVFHARFCAGE